MTIRAEPIHHKGKDWRAKCRDCPFVMYAGSYNEAEKISRHHEKHSAHHYCMIQNMPKEGWDQ